jgi:regulator of protease activity HflC (stomatin/prohibitin superfamily)
MDSQNQKSTIFGAVVAVVVLLGLITFLTSMRSVGTGKVGVVSQVGKVTGRELGEGFSLVAPWGFNNVTEYDIKTQKESATVTAASNDLQDVTAEVVVNYKLNRGDVSKIHQTLGPDYKDKVITPAVSETFKASSAKYTVSQLITDRPALKADVIKQLKERLEPRGIVVEDVSLTDFKFSESFSKAIEDKQVAQQNAERAKFNLEAAKTDAEAQAAQSKSLSEEYLRLKTIEKWNGQLPQSVGANGTLFNVVR